MSGKLKVLFVATLIALMAIGTAPVSTVSAGPCQTSSGGGC